MENMEDLIPRRNSVNTRVDAEFKKAIKRAAKELDMSEVEVTKKLGKKIMDDLNNGRLKEENPFALFPLPTFPKSYSWPKLKKNKRGSYGDVIVILVLLVTVGLAFLVLATLWNDVREELDTELFNASDEGRGIFIVAGNFFNLLDGIFLIIFVLSIVAMIYFSYSVDIPPNLAWIGILITMIMVLLGAMLSNVYGEFKDGFDSAQFPIMNFIFDQFPIVMGLLGLLATIIIYAKGGQQL